jgi:hypothetical protein
MIATIMLNDGMGIPLLRGATTVAAEGMDRSIVKATVDDDDGLLCDHFRRVSLLISIFVFSVVMLSVHPNEEPWRSKPSLQRR